MRSLIHQNQLKGQRAAVVGAARSGMGAVRLLHALGAEVVWLERDPERITPDHLETARTCGAEIRTGPHRREDLAGTHMVVLSPGVPRSVIKSIAPKSVPIYAEMEVASWFLHEPVVGVTGTNGKTTTTLLIAHGLRHAGHTVFAGGNLGIPLSEYLLDLPQASICVLESSSFQLEYCRSFRPRVALLLNFSANHLDHHEDMEAYWSAKLRLFTCQKEEDLAILPLAMRHVFQHRAAIKARQVYFTGTERFSCPRLTGRHNQENLEAAFLACRYFGVTEESFQDSLVDFTPLPHRLERVAEAGGVVFVDDSKATTIDALRAALESMDRPTHLLAGGIFKGGDLTTLSPLIKEKVRSAGLFGRSRNEFAEAWRGLTLLDVEETLEQAFLNIMERAKPGETVLLSPATSSFDQFRDYAHRGAMFRELAERWKEKGQ